MCLCLVCNVQRGEAMLLLPASSSSSSTTSSPPPPPSSLRVSVSTLPRPVRWLKRPIHTHPEEGITHRSEPVPDLHRQTSAGTRLFLWFLHPLCFIPAAPSTEEELAGDRWPVLSSVAPLGEWWSHPFNSGLLAWSPYSIWRKSLW